MARRPPRTAEIVARAEPSLLDIVDNLLSKGVVLNADLVLALANVDLVCVRLSALLCAADRLLELNRGSAPDPGSVARGGPTPRAAPSQARRARLDRHAARE